MKKILSLGIASAVLAMTALSASANIVTRTTDDVTPGATITVEFVADENLSAFSFNTKASGLTLVDAKTNVTGMAVVVSDTKDRIVAVGVGVTAGQTVLTQTYTVDAKAGEAVSVALESVEGINGSPAPLTVVVKEASGTNSGDNSTTESGDNSTTESGDNSGTTSQTSSTTSTTDPGKNPPTGVALAVFPAVIAGAAVVVAKKKRG